MGDRPVVRRVRAEFVGGGWSKGRLWRSRWGGAGRGRKSMENDLGKWSAKMSGQGSRRRCSWYGAEVRRRRQVLGGGGEASRAGGTTGGRRGAAEEGTGAGRGGVLLGVRVVESGRWRRVRRGGTAGPWEDRAGNEVPEWWAGDGPWQAMSLDGQEYARAGVGEG